MTWTTRTSTGIRNVHEREVHAPLAEVWAAISTLSTPDDRVWPSDRWPSLRLSDGLRPGSEGGHGPIRYHVTRVEHEAALFFAFNPDAGISGWHSFTLVPTATGTRVTHTLVFEHPGLAVRMAIVPLHDALLEDLLDQLAAVVERRELTRRPLALSVKARLALVAATPKPPEPTGRRRAVAAATATMLAAIGALHLVWGTGSPWPARTQESLARAVIGVPGLAKPPGFLACAAVAGALGVAAGAVVATTSHDAGTRTAGGIGALGASAVLGLRGVYGLVTSAVLPERVTPEYRPRDLALYSPLCLGLAVSMYRLARR